jgi:1,4-dihydroxy-6-naphthoate synthase
MKSDLNLYISTCPNDTFVCHGLINKKIEVRGFNIVPHFFDIKQLNEIALSGQADIIKVSTAILPDVCQHYKILSSGAALGFDCGPLVVSKESDGMLLSNSKVAIPGLNTTALKLFKRYFGESFEFIEMMFSEIEDAVVAEKVDAGLIIHENRFTFQSKGLIEIADLGKKWHEETMLPIPLGCFLVNKKWDDRIVLMLDNALTQSVLYAYDYQQETMDFVMDYAQTMDYEVAQKHINLYVNEETKRMSAQGKQAIRLFLGDSFSEKKCNFVV